MKLQHFTPNNLAGGEAEMWGREFILGGFEYIIRKSV